MADYNYYIPPDRPVDFMIGSVDAPGAGTTVPTYAITDGNTEGYFKIGSDNGVLEVADELYTSAVYPITLTVSRADDAGSIDYSVELEAISVSNVHFPTVYVDPAEGSNLNAGGMTDPVSSLDLAYSRVTGSGTILLSTGNYGDRTFNGKPVKIKSLNEETPLFDSISADGHSLILDTIGIEGGRVNAYNTTDVNESVFKMIGCAQTGPDPVKIEGYDYISLHRNRVYTDNNGFDIDDAKELTMSSCVINGSVGFGYGVSVVGVISAEYHHNTMDDFFNTRLSDASTTSLRVISNSFTNIGNLLTDNPTTLAFENNNIFGTSVASITPDVSNITDDPLYTDRNAGDFTLQPGSPNLGAAHSIPLGSTDAFNNTVASLGKNKDFTGANRAFKGAATDIGAFEDLSAVNSGTEATLKVAAGGFDVVFNGTTARPFRRLSKALLESPGAGAEGADKAIEIIQATIDPQEDTYSNRALTFDDHSWELTGASVTTSNPQEQVEGVVKMDSVVVVPYCTKTYSGDSVYVARTGSDTDGDGTEENPYETIDFALSTSAEVIFVFAGGYDDFTSVAGKKIVFLPVDDLLYVGGFSSSDFREGTWNTQDPNGYTTLDTAGGNLSIDQVGVTSAPYEGLSMVSYFTLSNIPTDEEISPANTKGVEVYFRVTPNGTLPNFSYKLSNARNSLEFSCSDSVVSVSTQTYNPETEAWEGQSRNISTSGTDKEIIVQLKTSDNSAESSFSYDGVKYTAGYPLYADDSEPTRNHIGWGVSITSNPIATASGLDLTNYQILADSSSAGALAVEYFKLTAEQAANRSIHISDLAAQGLTMNIAQGTSQLRGVDYEYANGVLTWDGYRLALDPMVEGTDVRVTYYAGVFGEPYYQTYHKRAFSIITNKPEEV